MLDDYEQRVSYNKYTTTFHPYIVSVESGESQEPSSSRRGSYLLIGPRDKHMFFSTSAPESISRKCGVCPVGDAALQFECRSSEWQNVSKSLSEPSKTQVGCVPPDGDCLTECREQRCIFGLV